MRVGSLIVRVGVTALALGACRASGAPASVASSADGGAAAPVATTHGEWVKITRPGGNPIRAYVAYPERKDKAPAIIVIHEIFGLTDWEPTVVDRLAKEGYVAIVPDLLSSKYGRSPTNADSGRKLISELEPDRITADLDAAYAYVDTLPAVRKGDIATIGFCWGGGESFRYATNNPRLKAAVVNYGPPPELASLGRIRAPVLGVYGENDARIDNTIPAVSSRMKALGKPFEYQIYPGTGHGFLKPGREGSDGPQVERAWSRILAFYKEALK
jgi:carboxymethylenebutenolidase